MRRAFTLIESVIYIALIAIVLPAMAYFIINLLQRQDHLTERTQIIQTQGLLFDELRYELQYATSISVTQSTFSSTSSILQFTDRNGVVNRIAVVDDSYTVVSPARTVRRLQLTQGGVTSWMTGNNIAVTTFQVDPVRDSTGALTALNFRVVISPHTTSTTTQAANVFDSSFSVWLQSYVTET